MKARLLSCLLFVYACSAAPKTQLINKNLDGWERTCDGVWSVTRDGVLIGERDLSQPAPKTDPSQAWLYTRKEYGEYDLHVEWWTRLRGNSGISLRDGTRGRYSCGAEADPKRTPSHIGYEIQISNGYKDKYPSGSIYLFEPAKPGFEYPNDWNAMDLEVRNNLIRVKLNGHIVAEHAGDPARSKTGPIGLQLHDHNSLVMFRNMWIQEITAPKK